MLLLLVWARLALTCVESQNAAKKPRKLRDLAKELLGMDIQGGEQ